MMTAMTIITTIIFSSIGALEMQMSVGRSVCRSVCRSVFIHYIWGRIKAGHLWDLIEMWGFRGDDRGYLGASS